MATTQTAPKKGLINFDFLQKLGKVLMTVIAVMPAAGLMISLGKLVQMGGGDIAAVMTIGTTMENIGWAVINNLHILFAVAIGGRCPARIKVLSIPSFFTISFSDSAYSNLSSAAYNCMMNQRIKK